MLEAVLQVVRDAGAVVLSHYARAASRPPEVVEKDDGSPLTAADRESNARIVAALERLTPDIPVIAEETGVPPYERRRAWRRFWLVDPLDGTKEFLSRNGEFTVNVGLIEEGEPVLGVVLAPASGVCYFGSRAEGAFVQQGYEPPRRIRSHPPAPDEALVVVTSRSHRGGNLAGMLPGRTIAQEKTVGSALKFGLLAAGEAHAYARESPTMEWDTAAGDAVFRASASPRRSSPLTYNKPSLRNPPFVVGLVP